MSYAIYRETQNMFSVIADLPVGIDNIVVW